MNFHFVTAVWGDEFTDLYLNVGLPAQLSPGNLFAFREKGGSVYKIFTTSRDAERIRRSSAFIHLANILPTEIVLIDDIELITKYGAMAEAHRRAIQAADREHAAIVFISPDQIWADGTFVNLWELALAGKRVVLVATPRLTKETTVPAFLRRQMNDESASACISSRELVTFALNHFHPITKSLFWDAEDFNRWPSHLYWNVKQEGFVARCFHLHPLMVNPKARGILPESTIDDDYVELACPHREDFYVVEDSDEIVGFEVSSSDSVFGIARGEPSESRISCWARHHASPRHRDFLSHTIRFHGADISSKWNPVETLSDQVVESIRVSCDSRITSLLCFWFRLSGAPKALYRRVKARTH
jgi:hypothetical protein